jgi:hypothetical protein
MQGIRQFIGRLATVGLTAEVWLDGSFLTEKIEPKDVDVLVKCSALEYDAGAPEQCAAIDWVIANQKVSLKCDSYALFDYPHGHPLHAEGEWWYSYWHVKWGFSRQEDPKGIAVILLGSDSA